MHGDSRHAQSRPGRATGRDRRAAAPGRGRAGPRQPAAAADAGQLAGLLEPVITAAGMDLETVRIRAAGRRRLLQIVVDADGGVSLDGIAELSRELSAHLDAGGAMGDAPYTLEVSSPGVDRPLTEPRHWRRARGRLVAVSPCGAANGSASGWAAAAGLVPPIQGRVIGAGDNGVTLDVDGRHVRFSYAELGPGRVQVEFGKLDGGDSGGGGGRGASGAEDTDGAAGNAAARSGKRGSPDGH